MEITAQKISDYLNGELEGDPSVVVSNISKIEDGVSGTLTFLANPKYTKYLYNTKASVVLVKRDFAPEHSINTTLIRVDDPYSAFASILDLKKQQERQQRSGREDFVKIEKEVKLGNNLYLGSFSYISKGAIIGDKVKIYPNVFIGDNVIIGNNTTIFAGTKIYEDCQIGNNCVIHAGVVIGSDGFGFAPQCDKANYKKVPQVGNVIIEDDVEIGANTSIDRATLGSTIIRKGAKLDNLIQIAHNVEIGENTVLAAQVGIAGSTKIGKECMFGGQVGISGHITIADRVKIGAQAGVASNVDKEGEVLMGSPAFNYNQFHRSYVCFRKLPMWKRQIDYFEKMINQIKEKLHIT